MMPRISYVVQQAIIAERAKGRTDRQIEAVLGLTYGILSKPYRVDTSVQAEDVRRGRDHAEWRKREAKRGEAWRRMAKRGFEEPSRVQGWRPAGADLVKGRPDAPHRKPKI